MSNEKERIVEQLGRCNRCRITKDGRDRPGRFCEWEPCEECEADLKRAKTIGPVHQMGAEMIEKAKALPGVLEADLIWHLSINFKARAFAEGTSTRLSDEQVEEIRKRKYDFMFCGVPTVVDYALPDGEARLYVLVGAVK